MKLTPLSERIGDRTHGATLGECEQWATEVELKDWHYAQLEAINADLLSAAKYTSGVSLDHFNNPEMYSHLLDAFKECIIKSQQAIHKATE